MKIIGIKMVQGKQIPKIKALTIFHMKLRHWEGSSLNNGVENFDVSYGNFLFLDSIYKVVGGYFNYYEAGRQGPIFSFF